MRRERILRFLAVIMLVTTLLMGSVSFAEETFMEETDATSFVLMERNSGQVIFERESDLKVSVAGLARLPALMLICEAIDRGDLKWDTMVTVSENAAAVPGSTAFLEIGESVTVEELLKCGVMIGAGDAIMALAEKLCGTEKAFLSIMNERLLDLGIQAVYDTISNPQVMLSANELALIGQILGTSESFTKYSCQYLDEIIHEDGRVTELVNPNKQVKDNNGCYGLATGSSKEAGYCGIIAVKRDQWDVICVVTGTSNAKERSNTASMLLDTVFANYRAITLCHEGEVVASDIPVEHGTINKVDLIANNEVTLILEKEAKEPVRIEEYPERIEAPFLKGNVMGKIRYQTENGKVLTEVDLIAAENAEEAGFGNYLKSILIGWLKKIGRSAEYFRALDR